MTADRFYEWIKTNKHLKSVATVHAEGFSLIDVAMKAGGGDTPVYLKNPELQVRMRRGLTFLSLPGEELEIARQGLPKFFDIDEREIEKNLVGVKFPVTIHNLEKLNGENAQVSYSGKTGKWIICSKNVAIAASSLAEAEALFSGNQRFSFALYIARHWFNGVLPNTKNLDDLKLFLAQNTLVGEVCDVTKNQHIVDNLSKQGLILFAITTKEPSGPGVDLCTMPDNAIPIFQKYGLAHVDVGESC